MTPTGVEARMNSESHPLPEKPAMNSPKKPRKPVYRKPCPDPPKGVRCPLCGSAYICVQFERKKIADPSPA